MREKFRKVKYTASNVGPNAFESSGYFHQWGSFNEPTDSDSIQITKRIIEKEDGTMVTIDPHRIKFVVGN